ncbi:MAG: PIG-L family deacetylase [Acidobacteria bacterium]|nr:PIG-L family deacetylase [Acidobacteriota bacterium]
MARSTRASLGSIGAVGVLVGLAATGPGASARLPQDRGAAGAWQKILKLRTTASAMHITAHPDDEHGGVLALLSRRDGVRLALLTLNRGQAGDNAIGPELFDGLGLIRTEELLAADRYYGVDDQFFTTVVDYGFSKRLDEALEKWGKDYVLRDVVRVIRMNRPFVLISRFQGNERDGHGNHQTAGLVTQAAFRAAGDASMFPEQIRDGLQAWQPLKLYIGGVREDEQWNVRVDAGEYSPWLGDSYANFARLGLSFQRSQNSGRYSPAPGPSYNYYRRVGSVMDAPEKEGSFFDAIDTSMPGLFRALGRPEPADAARILGGIAATVTRAMSAFTLSDPSAAAPALAEGLKATRDARAALGHDPAVAFVLTIKERQFMDALNAALGIELSGLAQPAGATEPTGPLAAFGPSATMSPPVPGQRFEVRAQLTNHGRLAVTPSEINLVTARGWQVAKREGPLATLGYNQTVQQRFTVTLDDDVALSTRPYFARGSIFENRYRVNDETQYGRPVSEPPAVAAAKYTVNGVDVEVRESVRRREPKLPYGDVLRELRVVPALSVSVSPSTAVVPKSAPIKRLDLQVSLLNNYDGAMSGTLALRLPASWTSSPANQRFAFARAGERTMYSFAVSIPALESRSYTIEALATANGREYREGYDLIDQRDLELGYLYRPSTVDVRGVDVDVVKGLHVGYVMGVGDQVPAGIAQLGYKVTLLGDQELASTDLSQYDAIMTGTRAFAVRQDLKTYNQRLLDYVRDGGNLIVLYNTQEFVPDKWAPFPAQLPPRAEEVSEEDSPVEILAPTHQVFNWPNKITTADFDGWVEQRGSKFFTEWDKAYAPMIATWDRGQPPQKGGWVWARYGKGNYSYFAYAFHRQLPYGVPGAYRLLANVLALSKSPSR